MTNPLVSCITPTYGRFHLLKEMYWCWLNQNYDNKELIIVNDQNNLIIKCDNPQVKIFNIPERFIGLGAKRNFCIQQVSSGAKYIATFDDDDLFLPNHISSLVKGFDEEPTAHRVKNKKHYIVTHNIYDGVLNNNWPFFGASLFNANIMKQYKFNDTYIMGEDAVWLEQNNINTHVIKYDKPTFIYRLGMEIVHSSGHNIDITNPLEQLLLYDKIGDSIKQLSAPIEVDLIGELPPSIMKLYNEILEK